MTALLIIELEKPPIMLGNFQQEDFMQEVLVSMVQTIIIMFVLSMFMDDNHKKP